MQRIIIYTKTTERMMPNQSMPLCSIKTQPFVIGAPLFALLQTVACESWPLQWCRRWCCCWHRLDVADLIYHIQLQWGFICWIEQGDCGLFRFCLQKRLLLIKIALCLVSCGARQIPVWGKPELNHVVECLLVTEHTFRYRSLSAYCKSIATIICALRENHNVIECIIVVGTARIWRI